MELEGKRFSLKGYFAYGTHEDVAERIESLGGKVENDDVFIDFGGLYAFKYDYLIIGSKSRDGKQPWNPTEAKSRYEEIFRENGKDIPILFEYEVDALSGRAVMTPERLERRRQDAENARIHHDAVNELRETAYKVVEDGVITIDEAVEIKRAISRDYVLRNDPVFHPIYLQVCKLTKKSTLDADAEKQLIDNLHRIIDPTWCTDGEIFEEIKDKTFCLTGDFDYGSRKKVRERLVSLGGEEKSGVSRTLDYLIVGTKGSEDYAYGNYGSKAKKAMELQEQGCAIKIVPEREFGPLRS
ncbi:MAG: hypothetical protein IJ087_19740 [Eggerthellaceae bacterium]|nr:hypothetical protein [Eggerthellaceae bacterium]